MALRCGSLRHLSTTSFRACVVGSGPAGFYTADALLKSLPGAAVHIVEHLPTPFGLVRSGVAPDHPEVKNVTNKFEGVLSDPRCEFFGNVKIGVDVPVADLRSLYDIVIFATGAPDDRQLGIPGEDLHGVYTARDFVGWYNGEPRCADFHFDLTGETALVVGQGNVAVDVARILLSPIEELARTDITEAAVAALKDSAVRRVVLLGRRGPAQAACTTKEVREMGALAGTKVTVDPVNSLEVDDIDTAFLMKNRPQRRMLEVLKKATAQDGSSCTREFMMRFLRSPVEFLGTERVHAARVCVNRLEGEDSRAAVATDELQDVKCDVVFESIGYRGVPLPGVVFDSSRSIIPNERGRVMDSGAPVEGLYVAGWIKRGPTGVIVSTLSDAKETAGTIMHDISAGALTPKTSAVGLKDWLNRRGHTVVNTRGWQQIDEEEIKRGKALDKPREKFTSVVEMLSIASRA